jgi:hypothetical protein
MDPRCAEYCPQRATLEAYPMHGKAFGSTFGLERVATGFESDLSPVNIQYGQLQQMYKHWTNIL